MCGQYRRILSPSEEKGLAEFIRLEVLRPCHVFSKSGDRNHVKPFNCSAGDLTNFKRRYHFISRAFHFKSRPSVTADQQEKWMNRIEELLRLVLHDRVRNTDETSW
jgi:hypothetical protein